MGSVLVPASDGALLGSLVPPKGDGNDMEGLTTVGWLGACVGEDVGFAVGVTAGQSVGVGLADRA